MIAHHCFQLRGQAQFRQPDRGLISFKHGRGKLQIQQPVLGIFGCRAIVKHKKPRVGLLPQHAVFQPELVVRDFDFGDPRQIHSFKRLAHVAVRIIPKDDPVIVELPLEAG